MLDPSLKVVGLPGIPVAVGDWSPGGHPEELSLLSLVGAGRPKVFMAHSFKGTIFRRFIFNPEQPMVRYVIFGG